MFYISMENIEDTIPTPKTNPKPLTDFLKEDCCMKTLFSAYEINVICARIETFIVYENL